MVGGGVEAGRIGRRGCGWVGLDGFWVCGDGWGRDLGTPTITQAAAAEAAAAAAAEAATAPAAAPPRPRPLELLLLLPVDLSLLPLRFSVCSR